MQITSQSLYNRISPKKIRELAKVLHGLAPTEATNRLALRSGKAGKILAKVIAAASANATNNHKLDVSTLRIKTIEVGKGPAFKRFQPVSRGMAHPYKKRTSHIKVILTQVEKKVEKVEKVETVDIKEKKEASKK